MTDVPPLPSSRRVDGLDDAFWEGCRSGEFLLHGCDVCGRMYWPASACVRHGLASMRWLPSSGRGVVHAHVRVHRTHDPYFRHRTPYDGVVIWLDEQLYFHSSLLTGGSDRPVIGQRVQVVLDDCSGEALPRFRPYEAAEQGSTMPSNDHAGRGSRP